VGEVIHIHAWNKWRFLTDDEVVALAEQYKRLNTRDHLLEVEWHYRRFINPNFPESRSSEPPSPSA
jgi:hypothetical protein